MARPQSKSKNTQVTSEVNSEVKEESQEETVLLKFQSDVFYNGEVAYTKGVHKVPVALGWADRWLARGAFKVDSADSLATSTVETKTQDENQPVVTNPDADNSAPVVDTESVKVDL